MPNWNNVRWDHGAANEAVASLRRSAESIERTAEERGRAAQHAMAEWHGNHRITFDAALKRSLGEARALAERYREAAARIAQASQRARNEQARRERERAQWRAQQKAADKAKQ